MATKKIVKSEKFLPTAEALFEAGAHFGHQVRRWNPKMAKYLWGKKAGVSIFDLEKTVVKIGEAAEALAGLAAEGKRIILVGSKRQAREAIAKIAAEQNVAYATVRWLGGTITNWKQVKARIDRLNDLKNKREAGELKKYTKKEQLLFDREITRLERFFGGLAKLTGAPEVLVVVDIHKERAAVREAKSKGLTIIGIADSNSNPDGITHIIPMNDDASQAIALVLTVLGSAIAEGKTRINK